MEPYQVHRAVNHRTRRGNFYEEEEGIRCTTKMNQPKSPYTLTSEPLLLGKLLLAQSVAMIMLGICRSRCSYIHQDLPGHRPSLAGQTLSSPFSKWGRESGNCGQSFVTLASFCVAHIKPLILSNRGAG